MKLYERTEQQMFDEALAHSRKQPHISANEIGQCRLRSPEGLKCFIGALISDEDYDPKLESIPLVLLPEIAVGKADIKKRNLATELQRLHDYYDQGTWEEGFDLIAKTFGLIYTPPQEKIP